MPRVEVVAGWPGVGAVALHADMAVKRLGSTADAARAGREWRKLFGANVPSEKELREAEKEVLAKLATERGTREGEKARE